MALKEQKQQVMEQVKEQFLSHIGYVIRTYRKQKGIDRNVLASSIGVDASTISRYELGNSDIKASTMAYISALCNFPMRKYTDIYENNPALFVENFKKLVQVSTPIKHRKNARNSNIPPRPKLEFDKNDWKWVMKESVDITSKIYLEKESSMDIDDNLFREYISKDEQKALVLSQVAYIVDLITLNGKRCPYEVRKLVRSTIRYLTSDKDHELSKSLTEYAGALQKSS